MPRIVDEGRIPREQRREGGPAYSPLAGRLALAPEPPEVPGIMIVAAGTLPWFAFFALFGSLIWAVLAGADVVVLVLVGLRRRQIRAQIDAGAARAYHLWRDAWYCYRCDVVWRREGGADVMSPARFQREVWARGGYNDRV
ncbi:hypothetical protein [Streptomyces himalayensis]|uniref:Uncharacterized protein n=1 Tax=Streptomyces himalayensis subsp. himalayensis TaxID=2756131 RepID=A0A7W0DMU0_9ACTN|nr:hypothetical protein [Streptomyces himalayensis]MBA2947971.1 hypothetical protein [Streptomyces himalayensis subsp. himalayensis]